MRSSVEPIVKDLVLIGGGHSHAIVLRMFAMQPLPGVRLTLISDNSSTPYSGMLPGHIGGFYSHDECHIDLRPLANSAQAQLYIDRVIGLDLANNRVLCANRPPVTFDVLSIDIGSTPATISVPGAQKYAIPAKPVSQLLKYWDKLTEEVAQNPHKPLSIAIVGGGAGGVELALSMEGNLQGVNQNLDMHLFQSHPQLMPNSHKSVRRLLDGILTERGVNLHLGETVGEVREEGVDKGDKGDKFEIVCESGLTVSCNHVFWVTQASAPQWLTAAGLKTDDQGFILVTDTLQSLSHPQIFAAGDIATMVNNPRPKAGVFAVRQGKPLFKNLRHYLLEKPLKSYQPQQEYLSLIGTGDGKAIANRGCLTLPASKLLWRWKDWIDRRFMDRFSHLPEMKEQKSPHTSHTSPSPLSPPSPRCAGCGSKVGSTILQGVLQRIQEEQDIGKVGEGIIIGLDAPDDAAVVQIPADKLLVQTIDYFPSLINDPYIFGQIAANHCLSDIFAMGATGHSSLAMVTVPYAAPGKVKETLYQLLSGAVKVLNNAQVSLIGGHTTEGAELGFGLSCNGLIAADRLLRKGGMEPGQVLILTKPLGTGTLFAADMRRQAKGRWIDGAVESMLLSNQGAAECLINHGATACTDVTGFGLLGHLMEMVQASSVGIQLQIEAVPLLAGAKETTEKGIFSSLYPENLRASRIYIDNFQEVANYSTYPLLFDPQTSGGLLASIPKEQANSCILQLQSQGYIHSSIIGQVTSPFGGKQPIVLI